MFENGKIEMSKAIDFNQLMQDVSKSRSFLGETATTMTGEMRSNFDSLLKAIDDNFEKVKTEIPSCKSMLDTKLADLKTKHDENKAHLAAVEEKLAQLKKQMADGTLPKPEAPQDKPVSPQLGGFLRDELLAKFQPASPVSERPTGVAWQDWNVDSGWLSDPTP